MNNCVIQLNYTPLSEGVRREVELLEIVITPTGMSLHDTLRLKLKFFGQEIVLDRTTEMLRGVDLTQGIPDTNQGKFMIENSNLIKKSDSEDENKILGEVEYSNQDGFLLNEHPHVDIEYHRNDHYQLTEDSLEELQLPEKIEEQVEELIGEIFESKEKLLKKLQTLDYGEATPDQQALYKKNRRVLITHFLKRVVTEAEGGVQLRKEDLDRLSFSSPILEELGRIPNDKVYSQKEMKRMMELLSLEDAQYLRWKNLSLKKIVRAAQKLEGVKVGYKSFRLSFFKVAHLVDEGRSDLVRVAHPLRLAGETHTDLSSNKVLAVQNWSSVVKKQGGSSEETLFKVEGSIQFSKMEVHAEEKEVDEVKQWEPYQEKKRAEWKGIFPKEGKKFSWNLNDSRWLGNDSEKTF